MQMRQTFSINHHACGSHLHTSVSDQQINNKKKIVQSPFCHMLAHLIISHLKVTHGLCDLMYTNTEVVLDLKGRAL